MATNSLSPVAKRQRMDRDYMCLECQKLSIEESAEIYCEQCKNYYCTRCARYHLQINPLHVTCGKEEIGLFQTCEKHKDGQLTQVCNNHSQLCCTICLVDHRLCGDKKNISESLKKLLNLRQLQDILDKIRILQDNEQQREQQRLKVNELRQEINACITQFENNPLTDSSGQEQTITDVRLKIDSLLLITNFETSLERTHDPLIKLDVPHRIDIVNILMYQKKLNTILNLEQLHVDDSQTCLDTMQQSKIILKDYFPDLVFTYINFANIILSDNYFFSYNISSICTFPDGRIIVADGGQLNVKLLDNQYNIVSLCVTSACPRKMCRITTSKVAVTVGAHRPNINEVQIIEIRNGQLKMVRNFNLQYKCIGIAYHKGHLYVASGTALYTHTLNGNLVRMLYEDRSGNQTVFGCALSPNGDRIYIINNSHHKLITLDQNDTVLFEFTDPGLHLPCDVHVTYGGQVLICGREPCTIIQVDREGKKKLTAFKDQLFLPLSVCYNSHRNSIIVGQESEIKIIEFKVQ
ncbi:uncharacterized protein LOC127845491 [Dreissena polymorpha]|uniref:B box-type domain-containing protein n=1 Tax=Dreissena polymorpha TaxID=45954 RepID=A0A9D4DVI8_DREPO|nr:uncharacterized protein LOC127845491 [Dreissena polymorpha]KAH3768852.1 hypothetical protein DPMN_170068 [Dreissena polymorpha]